MHARKLVNILCAHVEANVLQEELTVAVAQWVGAFASQVEGWVFESQPRQT